MSIREAADCLNVSQKSIYRYIQAHMFSGFIAVAHGERLYYKLSTLSVQKFIEKHGLPEERKKRAYHRRPARKKGRKS